MGRIYHDRGNRQLEVSELSVSELIELLGQRPPFPRFATPYLASFRTAIALSDFFVFIPRFYHFTSSTRSDLPDLSYACILLDV